MRREYRERFPRHRLQRKPLVSDHGTCVTHVPWCMSGRKPAVAGKTFPAQAQAQPAILRIWQEAHKERKPTNHEGGGGGGHNDDLPSSVTHRVPTGSLFPGKVITFDHGSLGPGKVLRFSNFSKKSWRSPYFFFYQKQVDESMPDVNILSV